MDQTFMKTKPVLPLVASMSLPMVLSMLVNSLYNIVDGFFVARISEDAMTALSLVFPVQNLITAVTIGFSIGVSAVISRCLGAGEQADADGAAAQGLALSAVHGVILTAVSVSLMPFFLGLFTTDGAVLELGLQYARTAFVFAPVIALGMTFEKIFQSGGRMTVTMLCMLAGCVTNILLDPLLIFGPGPFPALGMYGAALATGLGQAVNLALYMILYAVRPLHVRLCRRDALPRRETAGRLYAVGVPAALSMALPSLLIAALNLILSGWGQNYVLILGAYYKLQTFLYLPANGIVQGLRPLIGYNYGAKTGAGDFPGRPGPGGRDYAGGDAALLGCSGAADEPFHHQRGNRGGGGPGAAGDQRRVPGFRRVRYRLRGAGGPGYGTVLPVDLPDAVRGFHHSGGLFPQPPVGAGGSVARLLDHGTGRGGPFPPALPGQDRGGPGGGEFPSRECLTAERGRETVSRSPGPRWVL